MKRGKLCPVAVLVGLLAAVGGVSAAVVITVETNLLPETSADMPLNIALDVAPKPRARPAQPTRSSPFDFEMGQISTTPDDLRHRPVESDRLLLLSLLVAAAPSLGLLGYSWWGQAQPASGRD